eukprot:3120268-Prymnesium_polylepis.1
MRHAVYGRLARFTAVFIFLYAVMFTNRIIAAAHGQEIFTLSAVTNVLSPLTGVANAIVYRWSSFHCRPCACLGRRPQTAAALLGSPSSALASEQLDSEFDGGSG